MYYSIHSDFIQRGVANSKKREPFRLGKSSREKAIRSGQFEHASIELIVLALLLDQRIVVATFDNPAVF